MNAIIPNGYLTQSEVNSTAGEYLRYQSALELVQIHCWKAAVEISKYDLSEPHRFHVAKIAAFEMPWGTSLFIKNFDLSALHRFEIAKICASQDGYRTSQCIKKYMLKDEIYRFFVAQTAASQNSWGTFVEIKKYNLRDQHLFEVLKFILPRVKDRFPINLSGHNLTDDQCLELSKLIKG